MSVLTYRPCPVCGAKGEHEGSNLSRRVSFFQCENGHMYSTITANNGLLLETKVVTGAAGRKARE